MTDILRNSLISLYYNSPEILEMISQLNLDSLNEKFYSELYKKITPDVFKRVDDQMRSKESKLYEESIVYATSQCLEELQQLIEFLIMQKEGEVN